VGALYLQGSDLAGFGVPNATAAQIQQASAQIDVWLARREGLLFAPDANGNPCYMTGLAPATSLTLNAAIAPGTMVTATVTGPTGMIQPGAVFVIDIPTGTNPPVTTEALVVNSVTGQNVIFNSVQFAHAQGAVLAGGLTIVEQRTMPADRPLTQVSRTPVAGVLSGVGRYGYMRRGQDAVGSIDTYNLLAVMSKFGGPPAWEAWTPQANSIDPQTGQIWVPAGVLLAYYTEVRMHYVAGFSYASLPTDVKQACANIINNIVNTAGIPTTMQGIKAGGTEMKRFNAQPNMLASLLVDDDTKALLAPFRARVYA
jgi:hypothetical protein